MKLELFFEIINLNSSCVNDYSVMSDKVTEGNYLPQKPNNYWEDLSRVALRYSTIENNKKTKIVDVRYSVDYGKMLQTNYYKGSLINNAVRLLLVEESNEAKTFVNAVLRKCKIHLLVYWEDFVERMTLVTSFLKQWQTDFSIFWYLLVDFQLIAAYQIDKQPLNDRELFNWLSVVKDHGLDYDVVFSRGVDNFISKVPIMVDDRICSIDDFIKDPSLWASSGSSIRAKHLLDIKHNKWTLAYLTELSELKKLLIDEQKSIVQVFIKPDEPLKNRYIATSDDNINMEMAYLSLFIDHCVSHSNIIASYMNNTVWCTMFKNLLLYKQAGYYSVDVDQVEFDHQPSKNMVLIAMQKLINFAILIASRTPFLSDVLLVSKALMMNMNNLVITSPSMMFRWQNGIASGWKWTSLLGSIINWAENYVIDDDMLRSGFDVTILMRVVQGDDVSEIYKSRDTAYNRLRFWEKRNFEISVKKTLIDRPYGEFLRYVYGNNLVRGYPARMLHSIFTVPVGGKETNDKYEEFIKRSRVLAGIMSRKRVSFPDAEVSTDCLALIHLPTVYGGAGIIPLQMSHYGRDVAVYKVLKYKNLYHFQSERIGYSKKIKIRRRKFYVIMKDYLAENSLHNLLAIPTMHYNLFYQHADDMYFILEECKGKELIQRLMQKLTPVSLLRFNEISPFFTRKLQLLLLQNKLSQPTFTGYYNQRLISICSDDLTGRLIRLLIRNKYRVGVNRWNAMIADISLSMKNLVDVVKIVDITE